MQKWLSTLWVGMSVNNPGLYLPSLISVLAYFLYRFHQRRRESKVIPSYCHFTLGSDYNEQAEEIYGKQHGCQPIAVQFPVKWPLGIDVLRAQLAAIADNRLFAYQQPFIDDLGPNFSIKMLGAMGYSTIDPKNLEAMLSTRFEGT